MQLEIDRGHSRPLYLQVVEQMQERIRGGALAVGTRLPTIRALADELGLTRLTVHNAYAELQAQGWIESFVGRGTFVAMRPEVRRAPIMTAVMPPLPVRRHSILGEILEYSQQPGMISFAQAAPSPATFPVQEFNRAMQQVLAHDGRALFDYGCTRGERSLREQLAASLLDRSVEAPPEHLLVVGGAQQGIDLTLRSLLQPGDAVLVEEPTYLGMIERMDLQGLRLLGVPLDAEGIRLDALECLLQTQRPRLLYTVPTFHNPTGISMSLERRKGLLELAARYGLLILEDDIYGLLAFDAPALPPLKALDTTGLVIYLTSFSKVLMPGLRLGVLAATPPLLDALVAAKRLTDMHAPQLIQRAFAEYLSRGSFPAHVRAVRAVYRERRDVMVAALRRTMPPGTNFTIPAGGLSLWLQLPPGVRALDVYLEALDRGVACTPGEAFYADQPARGYLRLSFASPEPDAIRCGISILGNLLHEQVARHGRLQRRAVGASIPMV